MFKIFKNTFKFIRNLIWVSVFTFFCAGANGQSDTVSNPSILLPGMRVSATATSGEGSFSVSHLNRSDIQLKQGNGSVNNLLNQVPGIVTTSDAGTGLGYTYMRIRGIDHTRINVTLNGIALNDAESQGTWFVNVPDLGSKVQTMEVQRGAGTSNNGASAFGATMNFTTLQPSLTPYAQLSSFAGSFYTFRNSISAGTGLIRNRFSADISYSNVMSRGFIQHASAQLHSLFFTADYRFLNEKKNKEFGHLQFNLIYGNEKTGLAWNGVPSDSLATNRRYNSCGEYYDANGNLQHYDNQTDNYQQTHYQLHYFLNRMVKKRHELNLKASAHLTRGIGYYEEYQDDSYYSTYGLNDFLTNADGTLVPIDFITRKNMDNYFYGATLNFSHKIKAENSGLLRNDFTWTLGGALNRYDGKEFGTLQWAQYSAGLPFGSHWYDGTGDKRQYNLYGKVISRLFHTIKSYSTTIYADIQYRCVDYRIGGTNANQWNVEQRYLWQFFNPKAGVEFSWQTTPAKGKSFGNQLYFTFSVANREPTRADLTEAEAAKRPTPETLYDFELGYLLKHEKVSFSADAYFMYYRDQLVLTGEINSVGAAIMTNVDKSFRTGIEVATSYAPLRWFTWSFNANASLNKILDYTEFVDDWDTGEQRTRHIGTTNISFAPNFVAANTFLFEPVRHFQIDFTTRFVSRQYIDNSSRKEYSIDPYCVSDLQLSYKLETKAIPEIGFYFQINNIFNAQYESNAWLYRYYLNGKENRLDGYFPQAGIHFMGGISLKF